MAYITFNQAHRSPTATPRESLPARFVAVMRLWRKRAQQRAELAQLSARDARDLGVDPGVISYEASKPFWQA